MTAMKKPSACFSTFFYQVLFVFILAWIVGGLAAGCRQEKKAALPPPLVEVIDVVQKDVPVHSEWIGTTDGLVNATIRAQVTGYLIKQNYREGEFVKKGRILFEIDPREYEAALAQAKAVLSQAKGALDQAKAALSQSKGAVEQTKASLEKARSEVGVQDARWTIAKANLGRIKPLAEQNAVSKKDLDDAVGMELSTRSAVDAAKAAVDAAQANIVAAEAQVVGAQANIVAAEAQVLAAQANVEKAQLNLDFTRLTSPIDGIAGIAKAQIGNLVGPGQLEELTTISTVDPIKVYISVSEQEFMMAMESHQAAGKMPLELILADGRVYPHKGEFALADRQIDVKTGTIKVGALFPNPGNLLRPGQFGRLRALVKVKKEALLVPQRAVTELQGSYQVAVVGPDNKVDIRPVKAAERIDQLWVIDEGLKPGERVVVEGIQKVRQGMPVNPKPFGAQAAPPKPAMTSMPQGKPAKPEKTETR